jgi:subtilase family serine protease
MPRSAIRHRRRAALSAAVAVGASLALAAPALADGGQTSVAACGQTASGARCFADVVATTAGVALPLVAPNAGLAPATAGPPYDPSEIHAAYNLPTTAPSAQTIAIVDAFDDPNAESDLATFSSTFGLPACTTANHCFRKINQRGGTTYPAPDGGWGLEISLDVQWAHATCQNCKILLVEADSNSFANLAAAVNEAVSQGANVVSNSYGGHEFGGSYSAYNHKHVAITVSSGDGGYAAGTQFPASAPTVVSVGGTSLYVNAGGTYNHESAWNLAGSGCSAFYNPLAFKAANGDLAGACAPFTGVADVSAVADPNTGVYVRDTFAPYSGWYEVGGTSLSAPLIGGVFALAGNADTPARAEKLPFTHISHLHDVTTGSNGSCGGARICTAMPGWDGPTGLGTPNGVTAF